MAEVQVLYAGTANGITQLVNPGTSHRWRPIGTSLEGQDVLAIRASAVDPLMIFAGTSAGLYGSRDGGATWQLERPDIVNALAAARDGAFYAGTNAGKVLRGGVGDWEEVHSGDAPVAFLSVLAGDRLAAIFEGGKVDLLMQGEWTQASFTVPCASQVVASPSEPDELYITNETGVMSRLGPNPVPMTDRPTGAYVLLAGKPEVLLIGTVGRVYRSDDRASTAAPVDGPKDVRVLVSPPRYQDYAYAGTASGELWLSTDRGRTWQQLRDGLPPVRDLTFARVK